MCDLPVGWRDEPLGAVADIRVSNVDKHSRFGEVPVRLCNYLDVYREDYLGAEHLFMDGTATHAEVARFGLRPGDVIVTKDSETPYDIGVAAVIESVPKNLVCGYHLAILRPSSRLNPVWLAKQFASPQIKGYLAAQATGTTRYGLSNASLSNVRVAMPAREEQDGIIKVLQAVDEAIRYTEQLITKLQQLKQGLLHDLLTRGIDENGELRDPRHHPEQFRESPIGDVPCGWEVITLRDVGNWMSGGTPSKSVASFWGGPIPWASPKDLKRLWLDETIDSVSPLGAASGSRIAPANSVLIVVRGMILAHTFPVSVISQPMAFNQDVKAIVPVGMDGRFLAFWLVANADRMLGLVTEATHGTKRIELGDLHRQAIPCPPRPEQLRILSVALEQEARIGGELETLGKLRLVKHGLTDDLLTGSVRLSQFIEGDAA